MEAIFLQMLNMSIMATYVLIAVLILRLLLKRTPKWISYVLWSVLLFRLVCPVSFSSVFSLFNRFDAPAAVNGGIGYIPSDIRLVTTPQINVGVTSANEAVNNALPQAESVAGVNPMQILLSIGAYVWIAGIAAMLIYSVVSYVRLKRRVSMATLLFGNVFETDEIASPFVCGFFRPKIYLPVGINDTEREYVLHHEQTHILRRDHIVKPFAFLVLSVHWFNPFMWLAFWLMSRDMEMSCDERVVRELDHEGRAGYGVALVQLAMKRPILTASPLAFGESGTKGRVKNVLNYKKPTFWVVCVAVAAVVVTAICLLTNPVKTLELPSTASVMSMEMEQISEGESLGSATVTDSSDIDIVLSNLSGAKKTMKQSTNDYPVQSNYLIVRLMLPGERRTLSLYSDGSSYYIEEPYGGIYKSARDSDAEIYKVYKECGKAKTLDISEPAESGKAASEQLTNDVPAMPGGLPMVYSENNELKNKAFINAKLLPEVYWATSNKTNQPKEGAAVSIPSGRLVFAFLPTRPREGKSIFIDEATLKKIINEVNTAKVLPKLSRIDWTQADFQDYWLNLYVLTDGNVYNRIGFRGPIYHKKDAYVDIAVESVDSTTYAFESWRIESSVLGQILIDTWGPKFDLQRFHNVTRIDMRVLNFYDKTKVGNKATLEGNTAKNIAERMLKTAKVITGYGKCGYNIELCFTFSDGTTELGWLNGDSCHGIALDNGPSIMFDKEITRELYKLLDYGEDFISD